MSDIDDELKELESETALLRSSQKRKIYRIKGIKWEMEHKYSPDFNRRFKRSIIARDKCCLLCKSTEDLTVHHADYVRQKADPDFCVTLCRACNGRVNVKEERSKWTEYFKNLLHYKIGEKEDE
jgi:hypothetical protein